MFSHSYSCQKWSQLSFCDCTFPSWQKETWHLFIAGISYGTFCPPCAFQIKLWSNFKKQNILCLSLRFIYKGLRLSKNYLSVNMEFDPCNVLPSSVLGSVLYIRLHEVGFFQQMIEITTTKTLLKLSGKGSPYKLFLSH